MPDHDISPVPNSASKQASGHYQTADDIELPAIDEGEQSESGSTTPPVLTDNGNGQNRFSSILGTLALLGTCVVGGWFLLPESSLEQQHPNWQYVAAASDASSGDSENLIHLHQNSTQTLSAIEVSSVEHNRAATSQIRQALKRNDLVTATAFLQQAQQLTSPSSNNDVRPPDLTTNSGLVTALKEGKQELYEIELFDCCDEDGDVVEVLVNGVSFATVPISHTGTKLSIPLMPGNNSVTVRGIKDGGGGVTLSFRTSRGDYFARYIDVGEEVKLGVVVK